MNVNFCQSSLLQQITNGCSLPVADFQQQDSTGPQVLGRSRGNRPICVKAITSPIKGERGIVFPDLGCKPGDIGRFDIGGIGHDQVELLPRRYGIEPGALQQMKTVDHRVPAGVCPSCSQCLPSKVDRNGTRPRRIHEDGNGYAARASAKIKQKRLRSVADNGKRKIDQELGFGPWHQGRGRKRELQSVKFLLAKNTRNRLAGKAPVRQSIQVLQRVMSDYRGFSHAQTERIQTESVLRQEPRVKLGRANACAAEAIAHQTPGLSDRRAQFTPSMAASWAA